VTTPARTPDWLVERLHAGDLPAAEAEAVRARLTAEGGLGRLEALRRDDEAFAAAHPPGPALGEIRRRARGDGGRPPRAARAWLPGALVAAAAAAFVAVVVLPRGGPVGDGRPGGEAVALKGAGPTLVVHRQRPGGEPERLAAGASARAGDVLQLAVQAAGARYGVVVSIDGRGRVTRHLPEGGEVSAALAGGGAAPLPHAYELDDAPGFERFFLVTGAAPFDVAPVVEAARRLAAAGQGQTGALGLPGGLAQRPVLIVKR
jgi:hypothetical protein